MDAGDLPAPAGDLPDHLGDGAFLPVKDDPVRQLVGAIGGVMLPHAAPARPEKKGRTGADGRFHFQPSFITVQGVPCVCVLARPHKI